MMGRTWGIGLIGCCAGVVVAYAAGGSAGDPPPKPRGVSWSKDVAARTITAEQIVIRDAKGRNRLVLSGESPGVDGPSVIMFDADGKVTIVIGSYSAGDGMIITDKGGKVRLSAFLGNDGSASMSVGDRKGVRRVMMEIEADESLARVAVFDAKGQARTVSGLVKGSGILAVFDENGAPRWLAN